MYSINSNITSLSESSVEEAIFQIKIKKSEDEKVCISHLAKLFTVWVFI